MPLQYIYSVIKLHITELTDLFFFRRYFPNTLAAGAVPDLLPFVCKDVAERFVREPALAWNNISGRRDRHVAQAGSARRNIKAHLRKAFLTNQTR